MDQTSEITPGPPDLFYCLFYLLNHSFLVGITKNMVYDMGLVRNTRQARLHHSLRLILHSPEYSRETVHWPYSS